VSVVHWLERTTHRWIAYAAATWASIFAAFHFMWAAGWYVGLDPVQAKAALAIPWMFAYNMLAAVMCVAATPVALALGFPGARCVPRRLLCAAALVGTGLLVLRATASLVQVIHRAATGRFTFREFSPWELWFYLGAALFALDVWSFWRRSAAEVSSAANTRRSTTTRKPMRRISSKK
jgi:hypothetical protein